VNHWPFTPSAISDAPQSETYTGLDVILVDDAPLHRFAWYDPRGMLTMLYGGPAGDTPESRSPVLLEGLLPYGSTLAPFRRETMYAEEIATMQAKTLSPMNQEEALWTRMTEFTDNDVDNIVLRYDIFVLRKVD
jgi:hypothetical protein